MAFFHKTKKEKKKRSNSVLDINFRYIFFIIILYYYMKYLGLHAHHSDSFAWVYDVLLPVYKEVIVIIIV